MNVISICELVWRETIKLCLEQSIYHLITKLDVKYAVQIGTWGVNIQFPVQDSFNSICGTAPLKLESEFIITYFYIKTNNFGQQFWTIYENLKMSLSCIQAQICQSYFLSEKGWLVQICKSIIMSKFYISKYLMGCPIY